MSQNIDNILNELKTALKTSPQGGLGISDTASRQQVSVNDNGVVVTKLRVDSVIGDLTVEKSVSAVDIFANSIVAKNITAINELTVDTLKVKKVISEQQHDVYSRAVTFTGKVIEDLDGKGLLFSHSNFTHQFIFKNSPEKFFSTDSLDLYRGKQYLIDGVPVIETGKLGDSIVKSNLTRVGILQGLKIDGDLAVGQTLFVNDNFSRIGVNTDNLHGTLTIADGDVELVLTTDDTGKHGRIGSWGPGNLSLFTDNTDRITLQGTTVHIGSVKSKNSELLVHGSAVVHGDLKVHGVAYFERLVSDSRVERSASLDFVASDTESVIGKGVRWKGEGVTKQFFLATNFDRLVSTENLDLADSKGYFVNKQLVINSHQLGDTVLNSKLNTLGKLKSLEVDGEVSVENHIHIGNNEISVYKPLCIKDAMGNLSMESHRLSTNSEELTLMVADEPLLKKSSNGVISIGSQNNTNNQVSIYGNLAVNITNPESGVTLEVPGLVKFGGKKFLNAGAAPIEGSWTKGDITWNNCPEETGFIGWVCTVGGRPGTWKAFGYIGK